MGKTGLLLKVARIEAGLTQEQVAEKVGVVKWTISAWECGRCAPSIDNAIRLSRIYGKSLDDLFLPRSCT